MTERVRQPRVVFRPLHGVLLLNKPLGLSSQDALWRARRLLRAEKGGHTGTLDPLATGLLPLCLGAATKFAQVSLEADKRYLASIRLGQTRVGGDLEGEILVERPVQVSDDQLEQALATLRGEIDQVPPMHSALKVDGKALYTYARAGQTVERAPRRVTIHQLNLASRQGADLIVDVHCSKGTYVRTLAEDLGERLGCGAHLTGLVRTQTGEQKLSDACTLEQLAAEDEPAREAHLLPVDALIRHWPLVRLSAPEAGRFLSGLRRRTDLADQEHVRVYGPESWAFLGSGHITGGELIADRLLSPLEVQAQEPAAVTL